MKKRKIIALILITAIVFSLNLINIPVYGDVTTYSLSCSKCGSGKIYIEISYRLQSISSDEHSKYEVHKLMCVNCNNQSLLMELNVGNESHSLNNRTDTHSPGLHHTTYKCRCGYSKTVTYSCPGNPCIIFDSIKDKLIE